MFINGIVQPPKWLFCGLLTLKLFQTCIGFFLPQKITEAIQMLVTKQLTAPIDLI